MELTRKRHAGTAALIAALACCVALASTGGAKADEQATAAASELCAETQPGVHCGAGKGRRTAGGAGTGKVSHAGWPAITGVLLIVDHQGRRARGTELNDEILGGHGSDTLVGDAGRDVLWGDQYASGNNAWQRDTIWGGAGNDFIYPSHGLNHVHGGSGADIVRAYYGRGSIDCGAGNDIAQVRLNGAYRLTGCERVVHFCAHGSDGNGGCRKPGEARASARRAG